MYINAQDINEKQAYKLLSGMIVPRPIAWVSSRSKNGESNIAPFSFFTIASSEPPIICFSIGPGNFEEKIRTKDTLLNILETEEFIVNLTSQKMLDEIKESAKPFPRNISELEVTGVETLLGKNVNIQSVKDSPITLECKLNRHFSIGNNTMIFGEVIGFNMNEQVYVHENKINFEHYGPLARVANKFATFTLLE